jgi:hypothetical protein
VPTREPVALAEERFRDLTGKGFRAVAWAVTAVPASSCARFDPQVEQTLFIPQLQGG